MKKPILSALAIAVFVVLWVLSGQLFQNETRASLPEATQSGEEEKKFLVRTRVSEAQPYTREIVVRGRTKALMNVDIKAETEGPVIATPVEKGDRVKKGALICQISPYDREANLREARALAEQKQLEYKVAVELLKNGHRSETQTAAAKAQLDAALAAVSRSEVELERAAIRAPFDGVVDDRPVDIGDFLQKGSVCARILSEDPYLVVGEVSDKEVDLLERGMPAEIKMIDGREIQGKVRFVSSTAQEETRTFRIEVEIENGDRSMRDGMTAEIDIPTHNTKAHHIAPALLVLNDDGVIGVRTVSDEGAVEFYPANVAGDEPSGVWVTGLPDRIQLITSGQAFVSKGQSVSVESESQGSAK